ncbi:MAG: VWA domain-containing protein [Phycisphaerales bacterium]
MMAFITPASIAAALSALAIIAAVHALARDARPPILLPTARFLAAAPEHASIRRFNSAFIFLWRSCFALAVIAAIAIWLTPPDPSRSSASPPPSHDPRTHTEPPLVIVLDASGSMRIPGPDARTRFDIARALAIDAIAEAQSRAQPALIFLAEPTPRELRVPNTATAPTLVEALQDIEPTHAHADLSSVLALAESTLLQRRTPAADLLIITDGHPSALTTTTPSDAARPVRWSTVRIERIESPRTAPSLFWIGEHADGAADEPPSAAYRHTLRFAIDNPSPDPSTITLTVRSPLGVLRERLALAPNEQRTIAIPVEPTAPGITRTDITIDPAHPGAGALIALTEAPRPIRIALLDEPARRLALALDPHHTDRPAHTTIDAPDIPWWPIELIIADTPSRVPPDAEIIIGTPATLSALPNNSASAPARLALAHEPRDLTALARLIGFQVPIDPLPSPRTARLATPDRAAGLSLRTSLPHGWTPPRAAPSTRPVEVIATDEQRHPIAILLPDRANNNTVSTLALLAEPDVRDVRLPLLMLELIARIAPPQPRTAITTHVAQRIEWLIEAPPADAHPLCLVPPDPPGTPDQSPRCAFIPIPGTALLRVITPPLARHGLYRLMDAHARTIASASATPDPRELESTTITNTEIAARLGLHTTPTTPTNRETIPGTTPQTLTPPSPPSHTTSSDPTPTPHPPAPAWLPIALIALAIALWSIEPIAAGRAAPFTSGNASDPLSPPLRPIPPRLIVIAGLIACAILAAQHHANAHHIENAAGATPSGSNLSTLHLLIDRSRSMATIDTADTTRADRAERWSQRFTSAAQQSNTRATIRPFPASSADDSPGTPLLSAIESTLNRAEPGDAIILISDGADTTATPSDRARRAETLAARAAALNIPIHAIPLGPETPPPGPPHASLTIDPPAPHRAQPITARIHLAHPGGAPDALVRIRVELGTPQPGPPDQWSSWTTIEEAILPLPASGTQFELPITPDPTSDWLAIRLRAWFADPASPQSLPSPSSPADATALAIAPIRDQPTRILVLQGSPSPATSRLLRALSREPGVEVSVVQAIGARIDHARWSTDPDDPTRTIRATALPPPEPALFDNIDALILGHQPAHTLTPAAAQALSQRITTQQLPTLALNPRPNPTDPPAPAEHAHAALDAALRAHPPTPLFIDHRLSSTDDRWIAELIRSHAADAPRPGLTILTPRPPIRAGRPIQIAVQLNDPDPAPRPAPTIWIDDPAAPDAPPTRLDTTPSPSAPNAWTAQWTPPPASSTEPTAIRLRAELPPFPPADAWLTLDRSDPEQIHALNATDHALLRVLVENTSARTLASEQEIMELIPPEGEQLQGESPIPANGTESGTGPAPIDPPQRPFLALLAAAATLTFAIGVWIRRRRLGLT